ncbi:MAG: hypothetical protein ACRD51_03515 [Candidatus Acidiferrum sp.]
MKKSFAIAVFASFLLALSLSAQTANHPSKTVTAPLNWILTDIPAGPLLGQIICGPNSTVYLRRESPNENAFESAITEISFAGKSNTISPNEGTGLQGRVIFSAFNTDSSGNLYAIANSSREAEHSYLLAYNKDGHFVWKSSLRQPIHASFVLPLNDNRFLISGTLPSKAGQRLQSVTSIFDDGGNELKSLKLSDDDASQSQDPQSSIFFNPTIQLGDAKVGRDGSIYLLKASPEPTVLVIDGEGTILRTLKLKPPAEKAQAYDFFIGRRGIAIAYSPAQESQQLLNADLALYNSETGAIVQMYSTSVHGILACMEDDSLIYMGPTPDHKNYRLGRTPLP